MASVQRHIECKRCKFKGCFNEINCKTCEEYAQCPKCGYVLYFVALRDRKKMAENPATTYLKLTKDGKYIYRLYEPKTYGAYHIKHKRGGGRFGSVKRPITERAINYFKEIFREDEVDSELSYLTKWDGEKGKLEIVLGNFCPDMWLEEEESEEIYDMWLV